jgi:ppGpp synthetase/RelA/SpoT-type nucleotidyltranferase
MSDGLLSEYSARYNAVLEPIAKELTALIVDHLGNAPHIDRVSVRAKSPPRFVTKALKRDASGALLYTEPLYQIQDQIGARIIVYYIQDVEAIRDRLMPFFTHIEARTVVPESEWEFGYFGRHFVLAMPTEGIPPEIRMEDAPRFFELQIKTLFQHAWSEANHDLGYKPEIGLTSDQKRLLAYASAQAWGADRAFNELVTNR